MSLYELRSSQSGEPVVVLNLHLRQVMAWALPVGVVGLVFCYVWAFFQPVQFFRGYLIAFLFWQGISGGCLGILMVHHLVGGAWGFVIRRPLEQAAMTMPLMMVLGIPLLFGLGSLYPWYGHPAAVVNDQFFRMAYATPAFIIRYFVYFAAWCACAWLLSRWSLQQDRTAEPKLSRYMGLLSGWGLVAYFFLMSLACVDWIMSLEPKWYSTIFGLIVIVGQGISGYAFMIVLAIALVGPKLLERLVTPSHFHDLGNLLQTTILLWTYTAYAQYIVIWSGDLRPEISWYLHRQWGPWKWVSLALIFAQFGVPFFLLLFGAVKRQVRALAAVAALALVAHFLDVFWMVEPAFRPYGAVHYSPVTFVAPIGIGGIWLWDFARRLRGKALLPVHDPRLARVVDVREVVERG
jgi:hypothetical protein